MSRMSLERATNIMRNAGFTVMPATSGARYNFINNMNGIQKSFVDGYSVVRFVRACGGTTSQVVKWEEKINRVNAITGEPLDKETYVDVITGERFEGLTENELEWMFS